MWHDYNQALIERGNITIWFDDKAIKHWYTKHNGKPGKQRIYSNTAIQTAGIVRLVFHLAYRQSEGFMRSIIKLMGIDLSVPTHNTITSVAKIRPHVNARIMKRAGKPYPLERTEHTKMIRSHGVIRWQKESGYGKRSLVEVAFSRYKRLIGGLMHGINLNNQKVEAKLACKALNIMTNLGMPNTVRVS